METIENLNQHLVDLYGIDTVTGTPIWRVVWSEKQLEKRRVDITPNGVHLPSPMILEVPKYPYIKERWVLERLVAIPEMHHDELPATKLSYEPMFVFQKADGTYLPAILPAVKFIVDTIHAALGKSSLAKYVQDKNEITEEGRQERIKLLEQELFGDESGLEGKTFLTNSAIIVPSNYGEK